MKLELTVTFLLISSTLCNKIKLLGRHSIPLVNLYNVVTLIPKLLRQIIAEFAFRVLSVKTRNSNAAFSIPVQMQRIQEYSVLAMGVLKDPFKPRYLDEHFGVFRVESWFFE